MKKSKNVPVIKQQDLTAMCMPVPRSRCWLHGFNAVCCWIAANCFFQVIWDLMRTTPTPLVPLNHPPMCSYILTHPTPEKKAVSLTESPKWTEDYFNKEMPQGQSHQVICYQKAVTFLPPVTSDSSTWTHPSCSLSSCFCCHKPAEEAYFPQLILAG